MASVNNWSVAAAAPDNDGSSPAEGVGAESCCKDAAVSDNADGDERADCGTHDRCEYDGCEHTGGCGHTDGSHDATDGCNVRTNIEGCRDAAGAVENSNDGDGDGDDSSSTPVTVANVSSSPAAIANVGSIIDH